ncbi:ribose 5-phosphate isomerase B [Candidatus Aerophobetes bacterium]|uniref:Ribose 5-phosphate isomerase B n=1 Tax=Aerophobetes bacterium TaxID=2030807 RepID=A0A523RQF9_UNCAE|nr:MAG: ribose 5-phosphate isomerase B [Candidatus Aerophobetes bacterium]
MKIAIGSDHLGLELKNIIEDFLKEKEIEFKDFGTISREPLDYPDIARKVTRAITKGDCERGILICGTGIGMAIAANKVKGIRAAVCHDLYSTERSRKSNNAQIMTMGAQIIGSEPAKKLVEIWLNSEFQGGHSKRKVQKIMEIERENFS